MQKLLREYLDELKKRQRKSRKAAIAAVLLVVMVVGSVAGILSQYGMAMTGTPQCGAEEHQHGEGCYTKTLSCGLEEVEGHLHTESCYYPKELSCGLEEGEEHTHAEACYSIPEGWACGLEEGEGHSHTDECYISEIACGKEEHIHTDLCYTNETEDVESQETWNGMYAGTVWKGAWGEDLVTAARQQVGYRESLNNYTVVEDGSHKGYSRYGHFAGNMYADWDAAFVNFCMYYAGLSDLNVFPKELEAAGWYDKFVGAKEANRNFVTAAGGYEPKAGDLVFFARENEETARQMGIVSSYNAGENTIRVIEGNSGDEVRENQYPAGDSHITAYLKMTELEAAYKNAGQMAADTGNLAPEGSGSSDVQSTLMEEEGQQAASSNNLEATGRNVMGLDEARVKEVIITSVATGSAPFDAAAGRGNDTTAEDDLVRTFDTVNYNFLVNMESWDATKTYAQARVKLEFVLPLSESEAVFDQSAMAWMDQTEGYQPVITTETRTIDGQEKVCQVLTCHKLLLPSEGNHSVVPGEFGENVTIYVRSMRNGQRFAPIVSAAMEGGSWDGPCGNHTIDGQPAEEKKTVTAKEVEVTATPKYNIQVKGNSSYSDDFNFQGDSEWMDQYGNVAANTDIKAPLPGRAMVLGITLQLYNDNASKGLKGIELPEGDITFDLTVSSKYTINMPKEGSGYEVDQTIEDSDYAPLLWSYNEVTWREYGEQNKDGRRIDDRLKGTPYAPYSTWSERSNGCYNSGSWTATQEGDKIHITVSGYEIDPKKMPTLNADEGSEVKYEANVGCFSSGEIWLIQPFNKKEGTGQKPHYDIVETYGSGFFATTAEADNMKVTTVGGEELVEGEGNFKQMLSDDDSETRTLELTLEGNVQNRVRYADAETHILGCGVEDNRDGRDYAAVDSELNLVGGLSYNPNRVEENQLYLGTNLLKFYGSALELTKEDWFLDLEGGASLGGHDENEIDQAEGYVRIYYATKKDGSDWASDEQLEHTYEDELVFYDSLDKIPEGKTCVGMLISFIGPGGEVEASDPYYYCYHKAKVRDDMDLAGKTFTLASTSRVWTKRMLEEAGMDLGSLDLQQHPDLNVPDLVLKGGLWELDHYKSANIEGSVFYTKETYWEDGSGIKGTHNSDWYHWGDTLLIIGYKTRITKNLLQKESNGEEKQLFNLDTDQRVADFKLQPATQYENPGKFGDTARITIVDTLPKYMTYKPGSAYFGGAYSQTSENGGTKGNIIRDESEGAKFPDPVRTEPEITIDDEKGTQTLTWIIEDVEVGKEMAPIYYSVDIGVRGNPEEDIPTGTTALKNTVYITTPRDLRDPMETAEKHAQAGLTVTRGSASSFGKYTKQKVVDEDGVIDYVVYLNNNAKTGISVALMDTMPMNGVSGSSFTGTYTFTKWKLDTSKCDFSRLKIYYTFDTAYQNKTAKDVPVTEIETWKEAPVSQDGTIAIPSKEDGASEEQPYPVAWAVLGALEPGKSVDVDLQIKLNPGESEGDRKETNYFVNRLSSGDTTTTTETPTLKRTLEGLTWMDYDRDGIQGDTQTETRVSGVKVELLRLIEGEDPEEESSYENVYYPGTDTTKDENKVIIETGEQISVRAKDGSKATAYEQGRYRFTDLPAGTFAVRFTDGTETKITELNVTKRDGGTDDTLDSDGAAVYDNDGRLQKTLILNLEMPEAEKMSVSLYESKYHDCGFYPDTVMKIQKVGASGETPLSGAVFTIRDSNGRILSFTYEEGKGYTLFEEEEASVLEGKCYIALAANSDYVLGIGDWDGAEPILEKRNGSNSQVFEVFETVDQDGTFYTFLRPGSNRWLDLDSGNLADKAKIHIWSSDAPNDNQKWYVENRGGGFYICPKKAGNTSTWCMGLGDGGVSENTHVQLRDMKGSSAQKWMLVPVGGSGNPDAKTDLSVDGNGSLPIYNLIPGDYTITEIKSPEGHSLLREPVGFTLKTDGTVALKGPGSSMAGVGAEDGKEIVLKVRNEKLYALPNAGGRGIYWYSIGGVLLMFAAVLILYKNKRREAQGN